MIGYNRDFGKYGNKINALHIESIFKNVPLKLQETRDDSVKRFRPFVAINTEEKTNVDLAKWKKNSNAVKSVLLEVVIYGWDIEINTIVKIESSVVNNSFLVKSVVYKKSGSGTVASATLVSKDLYNV